VLPRETPRAVVALFWLIVALVVAYSAHALGGLGGSGLDSFFQKWVNDAIVLVSAGLCAARAIREPRERWAWVMLSIGLGSWALGNVYWTVFLIDENPVPIPSVADWLWLSIYPFAYVGLALLVRSRLRAFRLSACLDGVIAASAAAAISAAIVVEAVLRGGAHGTRAEVATNLAYPIGDLVVLGLIIGTVALGGWRLDRTWASLAAGVVAFAVTDGVFLYQTAAGTYSVGTIVDAGWLVAAVLFAHAAWQPVEPAREAAGHQRWQTRIPAGFALLSLGVLLYDHYHPTNLLALALSAATIVAVVLRMALSGRENTRLLQLSRTEATTDALTGLGNRRRLVADLDAAFERADARGFRLFLLDLNGFKAYNDANGHHAGDVLLTRLASQLHAAVGDTGSAYRLGGDEFCVLIDEATRTFPDAAIAKALSVESDGASISAAHGSVLLPAEASDVSAALGLVDARMYADKSGSRNSASDQASRVLLQVQREADGQLGEHVSSVASLALGLGEALGCTTAELSHLRLGAELHDVGEVAMRGTTRKTGPLTRADWAVVRNHAIVVERILAAAPALDDAAVLVRATHEHFDGSGFPHGLAGDEIPLGARIIAAADAYDAMTRGRHQRPRTPPVEALAELRRHAGSQFDPEVVDALEALCAASLHAPRLQVA
jgi:two-component system cell cycle response regulator